MDHNWGKVDMSTQPTANSQVNNMQIEQDNTQPSSVQPGFDPSAESTPPEGEAPQATPGIEIQVSPDKNLNAKCI